jgi:hypothetical protein
MLSFSAVIALAAPDASALFSAIEAGDAARVTAAIESGTSANARNADGLTALMAAVLKGSVPVVQVLLARGVDVNARLDFYGKTALTLAGRWGADSEIVRLLLAAGARRDVSDDRSGRRLVVTKSK